MENMNNSYNVRIRHTHELLCTLDFKLRIWEIILHDLDYDHQLFGVDIDIRDIYFELEELEYEISNSELDYLLSEIEDINNQIPMVDVERLRDNYPIYH